MGAGKTEGLTSGSGGGARAPPLIRRVRRFELVKEQRAHYISVVGGALVEPVVTLLDRLFATPHPGTTELQTGSREKGYAASASLLLVVILESFIARARLFTRRKHAGRARQRPVDFLRSAYPECALVADVEELFVLRDAIAHNHIWHVEFATRRGRWITLLRRVVDAGSGDTKFRGAVDLSQAMTRRLKLKVLPTMIDRYDVAVVLRTVLATLKFMSERENGQLGIDGLRADFGGEEDLDLWEIQGRIENRLTGR